MHARVCAQCNTFFADNMSKRNIKFTCAQVFVTDFGYTHILPMKSMGYVHHVMNHLFNNIEVSQYIIVDVAREKVQGEA